VPQRADLHGTTRLAAALDAVLQEAAQAVDVARATPALAFPATAAVQRAAEDALVAALALPVPATDDDRARYAPQPSLAELYSRARSARAGDRVLYDLPPDPGNVAAGVQLIINMAVEAALELHDPEQRPACVRLTRAAHGLVLTVDAPSSAAADRGVAVIEPVRDAAALYDGTLTLTGSFVLTLRIG
jgi:hypothetical protein